MASYDQFTQEMRGQMKHACVWGIRHAGLRWRPVSVAPTRQSSRSRDGLLL